MTRDDVARTLGYMERLREASYEAETKREERRMVAEYGRLSRAIRPYLEGKRPYAQPEPHQPSLPLALVFRND